MATENRLLSKLSQSISPEERQELLSKIQHSLQLDTPREEPIVHKVENHQERSARIQADMTRAGFFVQFQMWISSFFSVKTAEERFVRIKTNRIIKEIMAHGKDLIESNGEYVGPLIATKVAVLQERANPLRQFFDKIWGESDRIAEFAAELAWKYIPEAKSDLRDFIDLEQVSDDLIANKTNSVLERIESELESYIQNIHPKAFDLVAEDLAPLYYLREAVYFPYEDFLDKFSRNGNFGRARFQLVRDQLERLYYACYIASRWSGEKVVSPVITGGENALGQQIYSFHQDVVAIFQDLPLAEIIKAGSMDPYYRFLVYVPRINIRSFFLSYLTLRIKRQYNEDIPQLSAEVVKQQIVLMLGEKWNNPLRNIKAFQVPALSEIGLSSIRRAYTVSLYYHYVRRIYARRHESLALQISKSQTRRIRQTSSDMLLTLSAIDDVADKLERVNNSLSPEGKDGESLRNLMAVLRRDSGAQRQFRSKMDQLDRSVKDLSNRGLEALILLKNHFAYYAEHTRQDRVRLAEKLRQEAEWLNSYIELLQLAGRVEDKYATDVSAILSGAPASREAQISADNSALPEAD